MKKFVWFTVVGTALFAFAALFPATGFAQFQRYLQRYPQEPIYYGERYIRVPARSLPPPVVRQPVRPPSQRPPVVRQPVVPRPPMIQPPVIQPPIVRQPVPQPPITQLPGRGVQPPTIQPPVRIPPGMPIPPEDYTICVCFGWYNPNNPCPNPHCPRQRHTP